LRIFSFPKSEKVLKRSDFLFLSKHGKRIQNREFILVYSCNQKDNARLGITVTKKVGCASTRNRIKRLVREYFRLNKHRISSALNIIVIAKKEAAHLTSGQTVISLQNIFEKLLEKTYH
jgi:ribonuclease P protein component